LASHVRNGANSTAGTGLTDSEAKASLIVTADGFFSGIANPVVLTGGQTNTIVGGLIESSYAGSAFKATGDFDKLTILATGTISGSTAAATFGSGHHTITNYGTVVGAGNAFEIRGGQASINTYFENYGLIRGNIVHTSSDQASYMSMENTGRIVGSITATAGDNVIRNTGVIKGDITFGSGRDTLSNDGVVRGNIKLGGGAALDSLYNHESATIFGDIIGGNGPGHSEVVNDGTIVGQCQIRPRRGQRHL
jgi:hypothetical protein